MLLAQKLLCYHFRIDYYEGKTNRAADILFQYFQQILEEKMILYAEIIKILYYL